MPTLTAPARRRELAGLLRLMLPLLVGQLAIVGLAITDVVMSGHAGTGQLAGVTLGATLFDLPMMFLVGVFIANGALVGRLHGAGDEPGLRHQFHNSLWLAVPVGILAALLIAVLRGLAVDGLDAGDEAKTVARDYLLPMIATAFVLPFVLALRTGLEGMGLPNVAMGFNLMGFLVNIPLDYALIHGHWGLPALGGAGCGWATLTVVLLIVAGEMLYIRRARRLRQLGLLRHDTEPRGRTLVATLAMGAPIGGAILAEAGFFHVLPLVVAALGTVAVAAHGVAMSLDMLMFMVPLAISQAMTLRIARALGRGDGDGARLCTRVGIQAALAVALLQSLCYLVLRERLTVLYSSDTEVTALAGQLLLVAAAIRIFDALHIAGTGALRGHGDTRSTLVISLAAFWLLGFPLCLWLIDGGAQVVGAWLAILAAVACASAMTLWRVAGVAGRG